MSENREDSEVSETASLNFNGSIYGLLGGVTVVAGIAGVAMVRAGRDSH